MQELTQESKKKENMRRILLIINCIVLSIGCSGGPLILRLYFVHGGSRIWFSSFLQTAGVPVILIPLAISYLKRKRVCHVTTATTTTKAVKLSFMTKPLFLASSFIGILTGIDDYLYAYGVAQLPVSTASLITASQLGFTAGFAFLLVKQKFTFYSMNAVVLLTAGAGVLALHTSGDRPPNESNREYVLGFVMMIGASLLYGFILPLVELTYKKAKQKITYTLVLEIQFVLCTFASLVSIIGMIINNDFKAIPREAREFGLGETKYYIIVACSTIILQCYFLGAIGVVFCSSSLFSGIVMAVLLPVTEVLAVIFFKESFKSEKGVSLALSLWGFVSYFYGEMKQVKRDMNDVEKAEETELPHVSYSTN